MQRLIIFISFVLLCFFSMNQQAKCENKSYAKNKVTADQLVINPDWMVTCDQQSSRHGDGVSAGDLNGDGFDDVVFGAPAYEPNGAVFIYYGSANGPSILPGKILYGSSIGFGNRVNCNGDVNNDGFKDLIIGDPFNGGGKVWVYHGSSSGVSDSANAQFGSRTNGSNFGFSVSSADVNGDGYSDLIAGISNEIVNNLYVVGVYILPGSASGIIDNPLWTASVPVGSNYEIWYPSISGAGDINNDGFDDVIVCEYNSHVFIYYGAANKGMFDPPDIILTHPSEIHWDKGVSDAGDINSDGFGDIVVGTDGGVYVYYGSQSGLNLNFDFIGEGAFKVSSAGDFNDDGYGDLITSNFRDSISLYFGSFAGILQTAVILNSPIVNFSYGDINGDGISDVVGASEPNGYGFYGAANKVNSLTIFPKDTMLITNRGTEICLKSLIMSQFELPMSGVSINYVIKGKNPGSGNSVSDNNGLAKICYIGNTDGRDTIIATAGGKIDTAFVFWDFPYPKADITFIGENTLDYFGVCTNPAGDVNGDGYDDFIIGAPDYNSKTGRAYLYFGGSYPDSIPDLIFNGETSWYPFFGNSATGAGDLNGDGYDDIIIGAYGWAGVNGRAYIFYGGANMDNLPDLVLEGEQLFNDFGMQVNKAGDVNGDGFADVIVGARGYNNWTGRAYIFFGGTNMDIIPDIVMTGEAIDDQYGCAVTSAGDVNADGFSDVVVGAYRYGNNTGRAYLYFGGNSMNNIPDLVMTGEGIDNNFGAYASSAGDVNNDGFSDIAIGADEWSHSTNKVYIYYGGVSPDNIPDVVMHGENPGDHFASVFNNDDFDGDSYSDVFVGAWGFENRKGKAYLFNGGSDMNNIPDLFMIAEDTGSFFGSYVSAAGDINGDGYPDLLVGAHEYQNAKGKAYLYFGSGDPSKIISKLTVTPDSTSGVIGNQICLTGTIMNKLNQPMSNIRINYFVKGANDGYGNGFSDCYGNAEYCYTGINPGTDTIILVTGKLRDTAFVLWDFPNPVELTSFNSNVSGRNVTLKWTTTSELNNSGFEIENRNSKRETPENWNKVGFVNGNGTVSEPVNYTFTDKNLNTGKYKYRLKQIDFNGNFEYFELAEEVSIGIPVKYELSQNYPNPFNPVTTINYDMPRDGIVTIKIYDVIGREMKTLVNEMKTAGYYKIQFNAADLSSGVYFCRMTVENFVAVRNMVVLK